MTNQEIKLFFEENAEEKYKEFNRKLIPGDTYMYGVRIPRIRALAKQIAKGDFREYLQNPGKDSYEELCLWGFVIGYAKMDIEESLSYVAEFIPHITDWSVNDGFCATYKIAKENRERVWEFLMSYAESENEFEQRVVAVMLMDYFLTEEYIDEVFAVWDRLKHPGYYCKMGVAWGIATAYVGFPEKTRAYLKNNTLDDFTYNKAIQKMIESYQIPTEVKTELKRMKRPKV